MEISVRGIWPIGNRCIILINLHQGITIKRNNTVSKKKIQIELHYLKKKHLATTNKFPLLNKINQLFPLNTFYIKINKITIQYFIYNLFYNV